MRVKFPQIITYIFLIIFIIQIFSLFFFVIGVGYAQAIDAPIYTPQVEIAGGPSGQVTNEFIGQYIAAVYKYGAGIVGILAAIVMMFGGVLWLTAGGSQEQVNSAKEWIKAALTGLILASLSYIILLTINPSLVNFQPLGVTRITTQDYTFLGLREADKLANAQNIFAKVSKNFDSRTPLTFAANQQSDIPWSSLKEVWRTEASDTRQVSYYLGADDSTVYVVYEKWSEANKRYNFDMAEKYRLNDEEVKNIANPPQTDQNINLEYLLKP